MGFMVLKPWKALTLGKKSSQGGVLFFLGLLLAALPVGAFEMSGGGMRVTRDDVNPGGVYQTGGGFILNGSVGGVESVIIPGANQVKSGLEAIQDYPETIVDVRVSTNPDTTAGDNAKLDLKWTAPGAETTLTQPAAFYVIKYSPNPISNEFGFAAAAAYNQSIVPASRGTAENLTLTGLTANTSYYVAIEAQDSDKNQGYLSPGSSVPTVTLSPIPQFVFVSASSDTYIRIQWDTGNPYAGLQVKYEAQIADSSDFAPTAIKATNVFTSADQYTTSTTFTSLIPGTSYYTRVRSYNRVNVASDWSFISSTSTDRGRPGMPFFTNIQIDRVTVGWSGLQGPLGVGAIYKVEEWTNGDFSGAPTASQIVSGTSATFFGLLHNTTYWYRVQASVSGEATAFGPANFTMTAVNPVTPAGYSIYKSSASFTWTDGSNANNLPISYRVEISTRSNFTTLSASSTVSSSSAYQPGTLYSSTIAALSPNTTYYYRVMALNGLGNPTTSYFVNSVGGPRATDPVNPGGIYFQSISNTQFQVSWFENNVAPFNPDLTTRYDVKVTTTSDFSAPAVTAALAGYGDPKNHVFNENLFANTSYFIAIRAKGQSPVDNTDSAWVSTFTVTPPASVTNPTFNVGLTSATIFWQTQNGPDTKYLVQLTTNNLTVLDSSTTMNTNMSFVSLSTNTTYSFVIDTIPNGKYFAPRLVVTTSTLANIPMGVSPTYQSITSSSCVVNWGLNTNPPYTEFHVKYSTDNFNSVLGMRVVSNMTSVPIPGMLSNTTYWFKVSAVNLSGRETDDLDLGYVVTAANVPVFSDFAVGVTSITVLWNANGNAADTVYETSSTAFGTGTSLHTSAVTGTSWTDVGRSTNTPYSFSVRAVNHAGVPSAWMAVVSTWTLAAVPPQPSYPVYPGSRISPAAFEFKFSAGSNPTGAAGSARTQFAILITFDSTPNPAQNLNGIFLSPNALSGNIHSTTTYKSLTDPVWGNFSDWNSGTIISTGMNGGANYNLVVFARNGDDGNPPAIPTAASLPQSASTRSGTPVLMMSGHDAYYSMSNALWTNLTLASVTAYGSFHYHYKVGAPEQIFETQPGWNGRILAGAPASDQNTNPDYNSALSGFVVNGEGEYYVNVLGDDYPFSDQLGGTTPPNQHLEQINGQSLRFFVDLTKPTVQDITGQFTSTVTIPVFSGVPTPEKTPYFQWTTINTVGTSANLTSPIAGYSYSFSTDPAVVPSTAAVDPSISVAAPAVDISTPGVYGNNYYFKVAAMDAAGNWSDPATFVYMPRPDTEFPRVLNVELGGVLVPSSNSGVAVSTTPTINVQFSKRMYGPAMTADGFHLQATLDKGCNALTQEIPMAVTYATATRTATMVPMVNLQNGYHYELTTTTGVFDEAGNPLFEPLSKKFWTLMNPGTDNCNMDDSGDGTKITFAPGSWGPWTAGNAINSNPIKTPMAAPALPSLIINANDTARRISGSYAQPIAIKEFNLYDSSGTRVSGIFKADVTLTMTYPDANDDGIVDGTNPPIRASALCLSWLDEQTGVWVRVPGSVVDKRAKTVTTAIHHFSVYGIIGTPSMDLSNAYAYPVPFKPSLGHTQINFKNLSDVGIIRIYTINGELVKEIPIESTADGEMHWDVTNSRGEKVGSDVYLYLITNDQQKKTGKLMIVR